MISQAHRQGAWSPARPLGTLGRSISSDGGPNQSSFGNQQCPPPPSMPKISQPHALRVGFNQQRAGGAQTAPLSGAARRLRATRKDDRRSPTGCSGKWASLRTEVRINQHSEIINPHLLYAENLRPRVLPASHQEPAFSDAPTVLNISRGSLFQSAIRNLQCAPHVHKNSPPRKVQPW